MVYLIPSVMAYCMKSLKLLNIFLSLSSFSPSTVAEHMSWNKLIHYNCIAYIIKWLFVLCYNKKKVKVHMSSLNLKIYNRVKKHFWIKHQELLYHKIRSMVWLTSKRWIVS